MPTPASKTSSQLTPQKLQQLYAALLRYRAAAASASRHEAVHVATEIDLGPRDFILWERDAGPQYLSASGLSVVPEADASIATGLALALKLRRAGAVVLSYAFTPPAKSAKALRFAFQHRLPIVYVALHAPLPAQPVSNAAYGFPSMTVDENDVVALYRVAQEAIYRARHSQGPTLLSCSSAGTRDPLDYMRQYLEKKALLPSH